MVPEAAPVARTNWAVTRVGEEVFAFHGLGAGKTFADIAHDVHAYGVRTGRWRRVGDIPVTEGRLAGAAVTIGRHAYLFGGYTVSAAGAEKSMPEVLRFDPATGTFAPEMPMPVAVDDSVALPWRDRWIVLVSGWHDTGNVADVQLYDTRTHAWSVGTPWPGQPVFGHAGGLVGDTLLVCDGVTAARGVDGKHRFALTDACWRGEMDPAAVGRIRWSTVPPHPGRPRYRAGAVGTRAGDGRGEVVFAGGSERPYNYDGIGYDGVPAAPSSAVVGYDLRSATWTLHAPLPVPAMDFRGMIDADGHLLLFGGMRAGQVVSDGVIAF